MSCNESFLVNLRSAATEQMEHELEQSQPGVKAGPCFSFDYDFCFLYHCCMCMSMHVRMCMIVYPDVCFYLLDGTVESVISIASKTALLRAAGI